MGERVATWLRSRVRGGFSTTPHRGWKSRVPVRKWWIFTACRGRRLNNPSRRDVWIPPPAERDAWILPPDEGDILIPPSTSAPRATQRPTISSKGRSKACQHHSEITFVILDVSLFWPFNILENIFFSMTLRFFIVYFILKTLSREPEEWRRKKKHADDSHPYLEHI